MIGLLLTLVLALGATGTVQMADISGPGDTLYGVDQAVENFQLKIASGIQEDKLRLKFAEERVKELELLAQNGLSKDEEVDANINAAINLISGLEVHGRDEKEVDSIIEKLKSFAGDKNVQVEIQDGYIVVTTGL